MMTENLRPAELKRRLAEADATIVQAHHALSEGNIVSLEGLEEHVDITCRGITALSREEGRALQPPMLSLIDGLEKLTKVLSEDHRKTKTELNSLGDRERAQSAYTKKG